MKSLLLIVLALGCLPLPCAIAQGAAPDSGLLITRVNSAQWQVRLIAGSAGQQFSGLIESSLPISAVRGVRPGSTGSARLFTSTSLGMNLSAEPGGADGVTFSAGADARLCLHDAGSSGVRIYRGENLADAVPLKAPVALGSIDACGDALAPVPGAATLAASGRKYNPGHYTIIMNGVGAQKVMATALTEGTAGFVRRYTWRSVEPSKGVYDFSVIKSDLAWAAAHNTHLIVIINYKTADGTKAGPAYLDPYEYRNNVGGFALPLWNDTVIAGYNAMVKALGAQVDRNSAFEGLGNQESAASLNSSTIKSTQYTPEKYRDGLIRILSASAASLPTSRVFWFMNYLKGGQSYIGTIATAVAPLGVVMGGPDCLPDDQSLQTNAYPYYTQFAGKMPLFIQVEGNNYAAPHETGVGYWTMLQLYQFALTNLHVNYMFWMRLTTPPAPGGYDWYDALPVIKAHPTLN